MERPNSQTPRADRSSWSASLLVLGSFVWMLVCLLMIRHAWQASQATKISGLWWEIVSGVPALVWAWGLVSGRLGHLGRRQWRLLLACAGVLRLVLIDVPPAQSDDLYRYVWEGRVQWAGFNPHALAPDSAALAHLRDDPWERINHPHLATIYPPLAQWSFALAVKLGDRLGSPIVGMKLLFPLCEWLALIALAGWLARRGRHRAWVGLAAFHPLAIIEVSGNGHLDGLMVALVVAALWAWESGGSDAAPRRPIVLALGLLALTGAILTKLAPVLLLPFAVWVLGRRRWWIAGVPVLGFVAYLPFADASWGELTSSTRVYLESWHANAPLFDLIQWICRGNQLTARCVYWAGMMVLVLVLWLRRWTPGRAALAVFGYYLLVGPVLHPWYLLAILPLAAASRSGQWAWLWLTLAIPLDYYRYTEDPPGWVPWTIWAPFWILLVGSLVWRGLERWSGRSGR